MKNPKIFIGAAVAVVAIGIAGMLANIASMNADYDSYDDSEDNSETIAPVTLETELEQDSQAEILQTQLEEERAIEAALDRERRLSEERQRQEFRNQTANAWLDLQQITAEISSTDFSDMTGQETERTFGYYAAQTASIPTDNIDSELSRLVFSFHGLLEDIHDITIAHNESLQALDRDEDRAAVEGCMRARNQSAAASEGFWTQAFSCVAGGAIGAGGVVITEGIEEGMLNASTEQKIAGIESSAERVGDQFDAMPGYLEQQYGITTE